MSASRLCVLAGLIAWVSTGALAASSGHRFASTRHFIQQQLTDKTLPSVAVAVVQDRKIVWEEGFGWADREKRIPADAHTMYSLASISKSFTATGLMVLAERGAIDLDKPINDYLGAAKLRARMGDASAATIRRVANHSSGLPVHYQFFYEDEPWARPSMDDTILRYGFLATPPGELYNYSNLGYGVLGYVMERVSGRSYPEFMRREVFVPLGLTHTSVDIGPGLEPYAAQRYASDGTALPYYTTDHPGASAIYSSAHDLARFALFHLKAHLSDQKAILSDASIDAMHRHTIGDGIETGYAIGFNDVRLNGYRVVTHSGGMGGVATRLVLFPEQGLAVIVLVNAMDEAASDITNRVIQVLLPDWKARPPPSAAATPAFVPSADLEGHWKGIVSTYAKDLPVDLTIRANGEMVATFAEQIPSRVNKPTWEEGWLTGELRVTLGTPDTERLPYTVRLALRQQAGGLSGVATATGAIEPRVRNALSHWIELRKVPDGQP